MKGKIIVVNDSTLEKNPRLLKITGMLREGGFDVVAICWDRSVQNFKFHVLTKISKEISIITLRLHGPKGIKSLPFILTWWFFIFKKMLALDFDAIHVINFYSLIPSIVIAKLKNKPIVYDVEDVKVDHLIIPKALRLIGLGVEKFFMKFVDIIVLVDEFQKNQFNGIPNPNVAVIYDSPPHTKIEDGTQRKNYDHKVFKMFYAGYLTDSRNLNLDKVIDAILDIDNVQLLIAGKGDLVDYIKKVSSKYPQKIIYLGWLPYDKVIELSLKCDLLFSLREPVPLNQKYISGSKFLEALMCGKPILVNKGTSTAIKVLRAKCGLVVNASSIEEIKNAITKLKENRELCRELGMNGRKAYEQMYSWEMMKRRLLDIYSKLLNKAKNCIANSN